DAPPPYGANNPTNYHKGEPCFVHWRFPEPPQKSRSTHYTKVGMIGALKDNAGAHYFADAAERKQFKASRESLLKWYQNHPAVKAGWD
ncbi:hypothetical protein NL526_28365, partial [Klebsiella pneumoniae]|nr:hypothetical protein [Klebsiella pneumoniae]